MFRRIKKILYRSIENSEISYKKLQDLVKKEDNTILLDVRSKQEYEEGHLDGAINIPLYDLEKNMEKIPDKTCPIVIYCATGHRSKQAKEKLENEGYERIYHLKGGLDGI